jgi:NADP-dependent 3-hydroxy acid dehydrogenase YdfG
MLDTNLVAPFLFLHAFLPAMQAHGDGHIVTVGSVADRTTFPENGAYAASKFGLRALHEVLRAELRGTGVRATLVSPGPVDTSLWDSVRSEAREGIASRAAMLSADAVADAIFFAVTRPADVNVDEMRLGRA